ncbi:Ff.00g010940.m01.CDS01 [Fusarium sp. VM40]|nr:Ff.00g010940.m01.CDS01 [Fusarium sp. VM40]
MSYPFEQVDEAAKKSDTRDLVQSPSLGPIDIANTVTYDAVFGTITEDGPNYRNVGWIGTSVLMMKTQIGLGVLSIPAAFDTLGLLPGVICLLAVAIITTWSNYMVGVFKVNHPQVYGIDDASKLMFGTIGREVLAAGFSLYLVFAAGSGMLGISIGLNAISTHGTCTAIFVAVAAVGVIILSSIRTLERLSWIAWVGLVTLLVSVFMVTISVGVQDHPDAAPPGPWSSDWKLVGNPSFAAAASAISMFVLSYAGTPFFFPIVSEMRDPRHYTKALMLCQVVVTITYVSVGVVLYYYCGSYVASPALGSAGKLIKKISYGIALPGLFASTTLAIHLVGKHFFVRILSGSKHLTSNTFTHWATWFGCICGCAIISYCIASGIPVFGPLIGLIGALLGTLQCFQPMGCMWLYDNWSTGKEDKSAKWLFMVCWSLFVIISGTFLMISGTYGSVIGIIDALKADGASGPWSCVDNSNST